MSKNSFESEGASCMHKAPFMIIGILVLVAIVMVAFSIGSSSAKPTQIGTIQVDGLNGSDNVRTLSSSGTVEKIVAPDKVEIVLSVSTLDKSAQKSQSDNAEIADRVNTSLNSLSSVRAEVKTLGYSVNEEFEWNDLERKSVSVGYRTTNQIKVTLNGSDVSAAGRVIDVAVNAGANSVSSISFGLSKDRELEVKLAALKEAGALAKSKAQSIADGLGVSVGKIKTVSENSYFYYPNYSNASGASDMVAAKVSTPITANDVSVTAEVSVVFELQ
jgi:uncharacterized protein